MFLGPQLPIAILRILVGLVLMAHGIARLVENSLPGFGQFLDSKGFPTGLYFAWAITLFDCIGGLLMVFRKFVKVFCIWEMIVLATGIVIVHWPNGWFVVGMTLGGIEYSVVLIGILMAILIAEIQATKKLQ